MLSFLLASLPQPPSASVTAGKRVRVKLMLLLLLVAFSLASLRQNCAQIWLMMTKLSPPNFGNGDVANVLVEVMHVLLLFPPQYTIFEGYTFHVYRLH